MALDNNIACGISLKCVSREETGKAQALLQETISVLETAFLQSAISAVFRNGSY